MSATNNITATLRDCYRLLRQTTIQMAGGTNKDFDDAVLLELDYRGLDAKPINWVLCAMEIEKEEHLRVLCEQEAAEEQDSADSAYARWEAAQEAKYDYMKENY